MTEFASRTDLEALRRSGRGKFVLLGVLLAVALGAAAWSFLRKTGTGNPEEASKVIVVAHGTTVGYSLVLKEGGFEAAEGTLSAWTNKAQDEVPELEVTGVAAILELADRFGWGYVAFESPQDIDFTGIDIDGGVPSFGPEVKWAVLSAGDFGFPHVLTVNPAPSKVLRDPGLPLLQALFEQEQLAKLQEPESLTVTELQLRDRLKEAIAELEQIPEAERLAEKIVVQVREQLVDAERGDPKPALVGEPLESSTGVVLPSGRVLSVSRPFELVTTDAVRADLDLADDRLFLAAEPGAEPSTRTACESLAGGKLAVADGGDAIWASDGSAVVLETLSEGQVLWTFAAADPQQPCAFTRVGALAPTRAGLDGRPVPHTSGKVARVGQASGFGVVTIESVGAAEGGEQLQLGLLEQTQIQQVAWIDGDRLVAIAESQLDGAVSIVLLSVRDPMRVLAFPVSAIEGITDAAAVVPVPGKTSLVLATRWSGKLYRVDLPGSWDALFEQPPVAADTPPIEAAGRPTQYPIDGTKLVAVAMQSRGNARNVVVSADGRWVAYAVAGDGLDPDAEGDDEIAASELATGRTKLLTRNALEDGKPAITPDGAHVVFETVFEIPKTKWRITAARIVAVGS